MSISPKISPAPLDRLDRLHRYLDRLSASGFYGKVVLSFQHGKVHELRVEETKKLEEL